MKIGFLVLGVLIMSATLWAQGGAGEVNCTAGCQVVEDHSCGAGGCEYVQFTPTETETYCVRCQMRSLYGQCGGGCRVTATLTRPIGGGTVWSCDNQGQDTCDPGLIMDHVTLEQGVLYRLTVCFEQCYAYLPCSGCTDCYAWAMACRYQ